MSLLGKKAPVFKASAVINGTDIVKDFSLEQYLGKSYVIFFFYPKDFTFVCPTELHAFQAKLEEFKSRGCEIVACSTDTEESHWTWLQMSKNLGGINGVTYPVVADTTKTISTNYDVLAGDYDYNEEGEIYATGPMTAYRGLFLIDKQGVIQHITKNTNSLGRNIDEELRVLDALIHVETFGEVCPANWVKGKDAMESTRTGVTAYMSNN